MKNLLPKMSLRGIVVNNGVKIKIDFTLPSKSINLLQDIILLVRSRFNKHNINQNFEAGVYISHLRVTNPEDNILAIGVGSGSTLIPMVKLMQSSELGFYRCIEASETQIRAAKDNIKLNKIDNSRFEIIHAFAGGEVYGAYGEASKQNVDINDFDFDVLELDCEGSELSILTSLEKRPRNIIVELHPRHFPQEYKDFDFFLKLMIQKGYTYLFAYGHNGDYLDMEYARKYYNSTNTIGKNDSCIQDRNLHFFTVCPIVVTFGYTKSD